MGRLNQLGRVKTDYFERARNGEGPVEPYFSIDFFFNRLGFFFYEKKHIHLLWEKIN